MAAASSACCWLPLVAVGFGLGAGGAAVILERYRWIFLGAAAVLLGIGFYLSYRREEPCAPDGSCPPQRPLLRVVNRVVLWSSAALVMTFALLPELRSAMPGGSRPTEGASPHDSTMVVLHVAGMTCAACEVPVEQSLRAIPGVLDVHADAASGRVTLALERGVPLDEPQMRSTLTAAGYQLLRREPLTAPPPRRLILLSAGSRELRDAFNSDVGSVRLVALLSPT